jgi:hypothetical protein
MLHDALDPHGHDYMVSVFRCDGCREAEASEGICPEHERGFTGGRLYASRLSWALAHGTPTIDTGVGCSRCRDEVAAWCGVCRTGHVGNVVFTDVAFYEMARDEHARLLAAIAEQERCEMCGVSMFMRSRCNDCGASYLRQ